MNKQMLAPKEYHSFGEAPPQEAIIAIAYHRHGKKWLPHSVETVGSTYDFEPCVNGELVYHKSGFSGGGDDTYELSSYCAAPALVCKLWYDRTKVKLTKHKKPVADADARQFGYQIVAEPIGGNPFELPDAQEDQAGTVYCRQCDGYLPAGDNSPCWHLKYEEGGGFTLGCGSSEINYAETQASLYRLLRMLPPKAVTQLRENLKSPKLHSMFSDSMLGGNCNLEIKGKHWLDIYCEPLGEQLDYEERFWPGIAWLHSLDHTCKDALALTIGWLYMWEHNAWRGCCVVPEHDFIRRLPRKQLDEWLALDPLDPGRLAEKPLRVSLKFKPECANDHTFLAAPKKCHEVILWPKAKRMDASLTLSVARVKHVAKDAVDIYFGAVIERNGKHVSELDGYNLTRGV